MSVTTSQPRPMAASSIATALLPIMLTVSIGFLIIGMALPVLPLHVHHVLGLGPFAVGLITGSQFVAALVSRVWAGRFADKSGAKRAVLAGLAAAVMGGVLYLLSLRFTGAPLVSAAILLLGRGLLGAAESFIITGGVSWGLVLAGPAHAGRVIAWVGMAMFAALGLGSPVGTMLYADGGFTAIAVATVAVPLAAMLLLIPLAAVAPQPGSRISLFKLAGAVWMPGLGAALASMGLGTMIAFGSLLSAQRGWQPVWLLFSVFAMALVAARLFCGHLPDRFGGARVAFVSVIIETAGLALVWQAPGEIPAAAGAALTGLGFALVYPGLGAEAVRRVPPRNRGLAMGAYTACLDIALGFGSPALGLLARWADLSSVFLAGAVLVSGAAIIAPRLLRIPPASCISPLGAPPTGRPFPG